MGFILRSIIVVLISIIVAFLISEVDFSSDNKSIHVISSGEFLETELNKYKDTIGDDFPGYKGHLLRVYSYTMHFLSESKDAKKFTKVIEIALVYHDIALWTHAKLDYIEPSAELASEKFKDSFNKEELQLLDDLITYHHKVTPFEGPHEDIVNAFRKADWIDASFGILRKGISKKNVRMVMNSIPENRFHETLMNFGPKIRGYNIPLMVRELSSIFRW